MLPAAAAGPGAPGAVGSGAAERFRHHRALRGLIELLARERPVALLLDDLHWADEASLELVLHLLRRPPRGACLLAFALRPGERCARLLAAARATPGWAHLPLGPLSGDGGARAARRAARRRGARARRRGGGGQPDVPARARRVSRAPAGRRCPRRSPPPSGSTWRRSSPAARALIAGAAVAGDPFDPELAAAAAGLPPDAAALDRLVAAGLVGATGDGRAFAFRHPLVRRAVYDAAPPAWRLEAHERAAAALARRGAAPASRAYHVARFARAGDEAAIALLNEAAAAAAGTSPATAAHWHAAALALLPDGDAARRARLLAPMALALADAGQLDDARAALVEALELLPDDPTPERLELVSACAQLEMQLGRQQEARRRLLGALRGAPAAGQAAIAFQLATDAMTHGRSEELRTWAEHASRMAEGVEPVVLAGAQTLGALGALWTEGGADAAVVDRAAARIHDADDRDLGARVGVLVQVSRAQLRLGRYADAAATMRRALAVCHRTPHEQELVWLRVVRAWVLVLLLDLDAALVEVDAAEESARLQHAPHPLLMVLCKRMLVHHHRGEPLAAERAARECAELAGALEPSAITAHAACHAAALQLDQDPERCLRELRAAAGSELECHRPVDVEREPAARRARRARRRAHRRRRRLGLGGRVARRAAAAADQQPARELRPRARSCSPAATRPAPPRSHWTRRPSPTASPPRWTRPTRGSSPAARWAPWATPSRPRPCCSASPPTPAAAARSGCATRPRASCAGSAAASRPRAGARASPPVPTG